jgi:hypothetical protein
MKALQYKNQTVYTQSTDTTTVDDLDEARTGIGTILDAYFFQIDGDRMVQKIGFDKKKIEREQSGLMVEVKHKSCGQASVSIAGLDRIVSLLCETGALGDLPALKGRKVTIYERGIKLIGIGLKEE